MRTLLALAVVLPLAACSALSDDTQKIADVSCRAIGGSLSALASVKAELPPRAVTEIDRIADRSEGPCQAPEPPDDVSTAKALLDWAAELIQHEREI